MDELEILKMHKFPVETILFLLDEAIAKREWENRFNPEEITKAVIWYRRSRGRLD